MVNGDREGTPREWYLFTVRHRLRRPKEDPLVLTAKNEKGLLSEALRRMENEQKGMNNDE
jgi:hypothetical protein